MDVHRDTTKRCRTQPLTASMEARPGPELQPGELLDGRYRILEQLGKGGMGAVFLAQDTERGERVAVKVLAGEHANDPEFVERFMREGRTAGALEHAAIVPVFAVGRDRGRHYLVMAHLQGETLDKRFDRGPMTLDELLPLLRQLASGLAHLHAQRLVHRDVKPGNVMVAPDGRVTLLDFGLVRGARHPSITRDGFAVGTPGSMAPEQILGDAPVDGRADQYALGVLVFEALTGKMPFAGLGEVQVLRKHLEEPVPDPRTFAPRLEASVADAVMRAMSKRPEQRFLSVLDFVHALERARAPAPAPRRTPAWLVAVLGAAALAMAGLALHAAPSADSDAPALASNARARTPTP